MSEAIPPQATTDNQKSVDERPVSYRPDLPDWGVYLRWPADDDLWIHPDDVDLARHLIPSPRVFRRSMWDGQYYWLHYGKLRVRVKPSLWVQVQRIDLEVGQQVEVLSKHGENDAGIFRIREILLVPERREIEFYLRQGDLKIARGFTRSDLRPTYVRYQLRSGFFQHQCPKSVPVQGIDTLDVGDILEG
jgi:hypothetical protein